MRLLQQNDTGEYCLTKDLVDDDTLPAYAILSHTWEDGQEVTFEDLQDGGTAQGKNGWDKIRFCGEQAARDGLQYFWVDTCCIDKSNYGELKDAINSMFRWYQKAAKCYVYLSDISVDALPASNRDSDKFVASNTTWESALRSSRWFTRGWTLQELLAPRSVEFFSQQHIRLGDRSSLVHQIHRITGISTSALRGDVPLSHFNVNERLSWMENRQTTKAEDKVYSLLGIFGVYMPPVYGEGTGTAFKRLREEIDKLENCLRDLRLTDPHDDKKRIEETKGGLLAESYDWALHNLDFLQWRDSHHGLLWVKGDPGKGKTMLLCGIINELSKSKAKTDLLSFFFCQDTDSRINNATAVLRGLLYMLVNQQPSLITHIRRKYDHSGKALFEDANAWVAISEIFADILQDPHLHNAYLIIDGLDECIVGLPKLLDFLTTKTSSQSRVKWVISSRNWVEIEQWLERIEKLEQPEQIEGKVRLSLELNAESVSTAVSIFTRHKVDELAQEMRYNDKTRDAVLEYLESNANSTFLWVALVCQNLKRVPQRHVMKKLNSSFPPGLDSLYQRMMQQVRDCDDADLCKEVLATVATVFRPITLKELAVLVEEVDSMSEDIDLIREIISLCGSFLTLRADTIYFVHQSAKNFLLTTEVSGEVFPAGTAGIHYSIFSRSLKVLSSTLRRDMYGLNHPGYAIQVVKQPYPDPLIASRYSCIFWIDHLCDSDATLLSSDLQHKSTVSIFIRKKYLYWLEALSLCNSVPKGLVSMAKLEAFIMGKEGTNSLMRLVQDALRFIMAHKVAIGNNPLQVYMAGLLFSPSGSRVRKIFKNEQPNWITIKPPLDKRWSACLQTLEGHYGVVMAVAFSRDSTWLASASRDKSIKLWDTSSGECLQTLRGHREYVRDVVFSHDSKQLASASDDGTMRIWDPTSGNCLKVLHGYGEPVWSISFSHDSTLLASAAIAFDQSVRIWDVRSGECVQICEGHEKGVNSVVFSHDSTKIASGSKDKTARIWDAKTGDCLQTLDGHTYPVESIALSKNSKLLASGSSDSSIKIWDVDTGEWLQTMKDHIGVVNSVAFSDDSTLLASASDDSSVKVWDVDTGECLQTLHGHSESVQAVVFSHDSKWLASGSFDKTLKIWDASSKSFGNSREEHGDVVSSVAFSPDYKVVASTSLDGLIMLWDVASGDRLQMISAGATSVVFSHDSTLLASVAADRTVRIWDVKRGQYLLLLDEHKSRVNSADFSHDSTRIASGSKDRTAKVWNASSGECLHTLRGHMGGVNAVVFSDNSKLLASASGDQTVKIWDSVSGACLQTLTGHSQHVLSAAFSPGSRWLASGTRQGSLKLWDLSTGECIQTIETGTPLKQLSFDATASHLDVGFGAIKIGDPSTSRNPIPQYPKYHRAGISFADNDIWITYDGNKTLWLPSEYRPYSLAVKGNNIVIGTGSGKVWICTFHPEKKEVRK